MKSAPLDRFLQSARRGRTGATSMDASALPDLEDDVIRGFRQVRREQAETLRTCAIVLRGAWIGVLAVALPLLGWARWHPAAAPARPSALETLFDPPSGFDPSLIPP